MPTLAELLRAKTFDEREAQLLAYLQGVQFPVTDWYVGSVGRTVEKLLVTALGDFDALVPQIASGGYLGPIVVGDATYPTRDWLELLVREIFGLEAAAATFTQQRCNLWCALGTGPYTIVAGQLTAKSNYGRRYTNITGGTVLAGTFPTLAKLAVDFQAESPGSDYNADIAGTIVSLVTPLPGLSITNENVSFGGVDSSLRATLNGTGTGTVTPTETVSGVAPTGNRRFSLTVVTAGQVGAAVGTLVITEGATTTTIPLSPIPASYNGGNGVTILIANGGQDPSFLRGDIYTFETPGSPIINAGVDVESSDALRARARGRWPSLGVNPTDDKVTGWVREISNQQGYGITKIAVRASAAISGQIDIAIATVAGGVPGGVVSAVLNYVTYRLSIGERAFVESAATVSVTPGAGVVVHRSNAAAVKAAADELWSDYLAQLPIGGELPGGVVTLAELTQALMDAGAVDVINPDLNGVAQNLVIASYQVAVSSTTLTAGLLWQEIA